MVWAGDTDPYNGETKAQRAVAHLRELEARASSCHMPQGLCQTQLTIFHGAHLSEGTQGQDGPNCSPCH